MSDIIKINIDGKDLEVKKGITVLEAAKKANINIPTLCFLKEINQMGECRMCLVEIEGRRGFTTSCTQKVEDGMVIRTNTAELLEARRLVLDLILSNHNRDCTTCIRNGNCELQKLAEEFNMIGIEYDGERKEYKVDDKSPSIIRDLNKCILCRRCVSACKNIQEIGAIGSINRGFESCVSTAGNKSLADVNCIYCGQCIQACPTGALYEKDNTAEVWKKLKDPDVYTIVETAPAVRVALGEEFDNNIGKNVEGKMVTALKRLGFDSVFDTNTGADLTIMEEASEFIERVKGDGVLPMITSCCPAWIRYAEKNYSDQLDHLSSCKSPHEMFGAIMKSYYAKKVGIDPSKIYVVSVMPCVAKKYESIREEMEEDNVRDVDTVITTRELARMIKQANIEFNSLEDSKFDNPMGEATGAAAIFGTTGGVMEAALRTAADVLENKDIGEVEYKAVRGKEGIKKATVKIADKEINVVVASGISNAKIIMDEIRSRKADYQFVEIMACPGGCVMGGGQPIKSSKIRSSIDVRKLRAEALYSIDEKSTIRKSHLNPVIQEMYKEFLNEPGSKISHKYLHTTYHGEEKYKV